MDESLVFCCSWCPDHAARTAEATAAGKTVTHGACPACAAKYKADAAADKPPAKPEAPK